MYGFGHIQVKCMSGILTALTFFSVCFICLHQVLIGSRRSSQKLLMGLYFKSQKRGIGYSFQLAITAPPLNVTGYGTATAQS